MRLSKLELLAYGPFRGLVLDFSAPGIHVVFGRNEAGKSTALRAITGLLYGIDRNTPDAHLHKTSDLRIGGELEGPAGANGQVERVRVVRRKGNANTLQGERGEPIDEAVVQRMLGAVTQETFRTAFGLDHETLGAGARALLEGRGDLGESLFDASVGGGGEVQRLLAELEGEADRIYKPRATSLPLNEALRSFAEAQKVVRERQSLPEAFLVQEKALEDAARERAARLAETKELRARRERLERWRRRAPIERRHRRAQEARGALGALGASEELARAFRLRERFSAYERSLEARRQHVEEAARLAERIGHAARRAGLPDRALPGEGAGEDDADAAALDARKEARVHKLLRERAALDKDLDAARKEIARLERELARLGAREDDAAAPAPAGLDDVDTGTLSLSIERARALGDVEARLATSRAQIERARRRLEERAASAGLFEGTLAAFVSLRLPLPAVVEALEQRAATASAALARLDERLAELEREAGALAKQIASSSGDFAPPDVAALQAARRARDEAWRALREVEAGGRHAAELEVERLLRDTDAVADRMLHEADRVTTLARLRSEAEVVAAQLAEHRASRAKIAEDRAGLDEELAALFAPAALRPPARDAFAAMRQWLERHAQIVEAHDALRDADAAAADEEEKALRAKRDLASAISAGGDPDGTQPGPPPDPRPLTELLGAATKLLGAVDASRRARDEAARAAVKLRAELDGRVLDRERADTRRAELDAQLAELLTPLGIAGDTPAEEVNGAIEAMRELSLLEDKRADAASRARAAEAEVREFEEDLARVLADLAPDLAEPSARRERAPSSPRAPREAAVTLFQRAEEAGAVLSELAAARAALDAEDAAGEVVVDDAERALLAEPEAAERASQELSDRIDELEADTHRLTEHVGSLRAGLDAMRAESQAADAAALAQHHLARVRENVDRWARLKLAASLLAREIERYREENQGPLLTAASALFSRLTLGAYAGIKAAFDDKDRPCLRAVRASAGGGTTEVDVAGLSDGTRDQLYLALRLASLLRHAAAAGDRAMPLILDDVLIQLDDERATAALAVLAEVSEQLQVLFFTHHARLVELARAAIPAARLVVHELPSPRPAAIGRAETDDADVRP